MEEKSPKSPANSESARQSADKLNRIVELFRLVELYDDIPESMDPGTEPMNIIYDTVHQEIEKQINEIWDELRDLTIERHNLRSLISSTYTDLQHNKNIVYAQSLWSTEETETLHHFKQQVKELTLKKESTNNEYNDNQRRITNITINFYGPIGAVLAIAVAGFRVLSDEDKDKIIDQATIDTIAFRMTGH